MNQEPYRFYPYALALLLVISAPCLFAIGHKTLPITLRLVLAIGLVATIPTSLSFYRDTDPLLLRVSSIEKDGFTATADALPPTGIALLDPCINARVFSSLSDARIVDYNKGLAIPSNREAIDKVIAKQASGLFASDREFAVAGVTSFVTTSTCQGADLENLEKRFGKPTAVPITNASKIGLPENFRYYIFDIS